METPPPRSNSPLGLALEWVGRIVAIGLLMILPIIAGNALDRLWGTQFLGMIGMFLGFATGLFVLLVFTGVFANRR